MSESLFTSWHLVHDIGILGMILLCFSMQEEILYHIDEKVSCVYMLVCKRTIFLRILMSSVIWVDLYTVHDIIEHTHAKILVSVLGNTWILSKEGKKLTNKLLVVKAIEFAPMSSLMVLSGTLLSCHPASTLFQLNNHFPPSPPILLSTLHTIFIW